MLERVILGPKPRQYLIFQFSFLGLLSILSTGCVPPRLTEGIAFATDHHQVRDASALRVTDRGYLRFNLALRSDLDEAASQSEPKLLVDQGADVLTRAGKLAVSTTADEIDRLPPEGLRLLVSRYAPQETLPDDAASREYLKTAFATQARQALDDDLRALRETSDPQKVRSFLKGIREKVEPPPGDQGKLGRILLTAPLFLPATIGAEMVERESTRRGVIADIHQAVQYQPTDLEPVADAKNLEQANEAQLAAWFAPVLFQQVEQNPPYPESEDRIGRVYLTGTPSHPEVNVDTDDPVVYWRAQEASINGRAYAQLVYVGWYPSRPALKADDPEAGHIDGLIIRITLDHHHRPAIYEFVRSCGCYHTLWVAEFVEALARQQFGPPEDRQGHAVQLPTGRKRLFMPELVTDNGARPQRPEAFVSAGRHLLLSIKPSDGTQIVPQISAHKSYRLEPYDHLKRLPLNGGFASMFGSDGLVHNAGRREGWLLAPTGMLSAGQPRQLGTMKIQMDAYDFDDPRLLEKNLRLPDEF